MDPNIPNVDVTVTFNPVSAPKRVSFDKNDQVVFHPPSGKVTFKLKVDTALRVVFPSNPIQWVRQSGGDLLPIQQPSEAAVSRVNDFNTEVTITSSTPGDFRFYVIVQTPDSTDGRFFGSDPTIVIMRPGE